MDKRGRVLMNCWRCSSNNIEIIGSMGLCSNQDWKTVVESWNVYECQDCKAWFDDLDKYQINDEGK